MISRDYDLLICKLKAKHKFSGINGIVAYAVSESTIRIFVNNIESSKEIPENFAGKNIVVIIVGAN